MGRRHSARCNPARCPHGRITCAPDAGKVAAIQSAIEESVRRYAKGDGFAIPKAAYVIAMGKKVRMEKEEERKQRAAA